MPSPNALFRAAVPALALAATLSTPAVAQTAPNAQCDAVMMQGTQHFAPSVVAGCRAYFQSLADNAAAPGTFHSPVQRGQTVIVSTSGSGG